MHFQHQVNTQFQIIFTSGATLHTEARVVTMKILRALENHQKDPTMGDRNSILQEMGP